MGGNALKNTYTRRYSKDEFLTIANDVTSLLSKKGIVSAIPLYFKNKDSFGDLDVLIKKTTLPDDVNNIIHDLFSPNQIYSNSHVKSFDYKEFQVDFIMVKDEYWESSKFYFSYNDLGNFVGRIAYRLGFRFGDFGLKYVYIHTNGGEKYEQIVSTDPRKIYEFLGFDYDRYLEGFDELHDIFEYVITSKYFSPDIFAYENLNHQNKTRNKKRKNYSGFLEFISDMNTRETKERKWAKNSNIKDAEEFFGVDLTSGINIFNNDVESLKLASAKFNGDVIKEYFDLSGKELGNAITKYKDSVYSASPSTLSPNEKKRFFVEHIISNDLAIILNEFGHVLNNNIKQ